MSWPARCGPRTSASQLIPVALGGAAMLTAGYWAAGGAVAAAFALTLLAVLIFRMFRGADGYVRDVTGGRVRHGLPGPARRLRSRRCWPRTTAASAC